jgi:hypothetical protein
MSDVQDMSVFTPDPNEFDANKVLAEHAAATPEVPVDMQDSGEPIPEPEFNPEAVLKDYEDEQQYGGKPIKAASLAALSTATLSLSDRALIKSGVYTKDELKEIKIRNPGASLAGEVAGVVIPALIPGGQAEAGIEAMTIGARILKGATKADLIPTRAMAKTATAIGSAFESAIATSGSKVLAREVVKKSLAKSAEGAIEGSAFAVNSLLREDALGETDFNAENIMAHAGTGALFGSLLGASTSLFGSGLKAVGSGVKKGGRLFAKGTKDLMDPEKAAMDIFGVSKTEQIDLATSIEGQAFKKDALDFLQNKVGMENLDTQANLYAKTNKFLKSTGSDLDAVAKDIDGQMTLREQPGVWNRQQKLFNNIADEYENRLRDIPKLAENMTERRALTNGARDWRKLAETNEEGMSFQDIWNHKKAMDSRLYTAGGVHITGKEVDAAREGGRRLLRQEMSDYAKVFGPEIQIKLDAKMHDYSVARKAENYIYKTLGKAPEKALPSAKDAIMAHMGLISTDAASMARYFKNRVIVLNGIEKANVQFGEKVKVAADKFFKFNKTAGIGIQKAAITMLNNSSLAKTESDKGIRSEPKTRQEAYENTAKKLSEFTAQPDKLVESTVKAGSLLSSAAPETAYHLGVKLTTAVQFLQSKIPKRAHDVASLYGKERPYQPSSMELSKFERYLQVVEQPLSVVDELSNGTLTREHVEALQVVYPKIYSNLQQQFMLKMRSEEEGSVPYSKRIQLGMLFNIPTDTSLISSNVVGLQAQFQEKRDQQEQAAQGAAQSQASHVKATVTGAGKLDMSTREGSDVTNFETRRHRK